MGHFNEQKYNTAVAERNHVASQLAEMQKQVDLSNNERKVWDAALTALSMGNIEPMRKLAEAYKNAITQMPQAAPGMISVDQVRAEQEQVANGQRFINEVIMPQAVDIAKRYGADVKEVAGAIEHFIRRDLGFLTREKVEQIIQYEVPALFEANGYSANAEAGQTNQATQPNSEVAELKKTVDALQARIANTAKVSTRRRRSNTRGR